MPTADEDELAGVAGIKQSATEAWRKRGKGPPHIVFGNVTLYPRE
jgi:hypothetical protein